MVIREAPNSPSLAPTVWVGMEYTDMQVQYRDHVDLRDKMEQKCDNRFIRARVLYWLNSTLNTNGV